MGFIRCEDKTIRKPITWPIREPITWPNMCVWCLAEPTRTYKVNQGGFVLISYRHTVSCPICATHYLWLKVVGIIPFFVLVGGWVLFDKGLLTPRVFYLLSHLIYLALLCGSVLIRYLIEPVRISEDRGWYSITIRNETYAREFAVLNNLDNIKQSISIEQGLKEHLEVLRLEFNALAEKFYCTKSKEERSKIDVERDRIDKEMDRLRSQLNEW